MWLSNLSSSIYISAYRDQQITVPLKEPLNTLDIAAATAIIVAFIAISIFFKPGNRLFSERGSLAWWIASASLLVIYWNPTLDMINTGLVVEKGYSGLWFLKDVLLTIGIAPILFVPMWARLNITTDNQLIPLRYSGRSARILQVFRAVYVGLLVCAFLISYYLIAMRKVIQYFFDISDLQFAFFAVLGILLIVSKNDLHRKLRSDVLVSALYLVIPLIAIYFLVDSLGGWSTMHGQLTTIHKEEIELWPSGADGQETIPNILIFLLAQWWSARVLDHSNVNTQRYFAIGNTWGAFKAIMLPLLIISIMFGLSSLVWDAAILQAGKYPDAEASYVYLLLDAMPSGLKGLLFVTFILGFVTTIEAYLSWGASFLVEDVLKAGNSPDYKSARVIGYLIMASIGLISILITYYTDLLVTLKQFVFSISAGVGPVFLLRWFWWRINAWAHLAAMIASMIFTISFDYFFDSGGDISRWIVSIMQYANMDYYPVKLVILTLLVTITWVTVMYITPPDDKKHLQKFVSKTQTGGIWPFSTGRFYWRKKLALIFLFGLLGILPVWIIWLLKFSSVTFGVVLLSFWGAMTLVVYKQMHSLLKERNK